MLLSISGMQDILDIDKKLLHEQTLWNSDRTRTDHRIYQNHGEDFKHDVNIVLEETNHHFFYDGYIGPKIGYNIWESTEQPTEFFNQLLEYDQIWVPSKWQRECTIKQGADPDQVKVVPEGVDVNTFYPEDPQTVLDYVDGRFKFVLFGRWDYRKSTKEIIETFLKEFKSNEPVDLIVSIIFGYKFFLSPKTSNLTNFQPPISLASLSVLKASSEVKQPAVLGR